MPACANIICTVYVPCGTLRVGNPGESGGTDGLREMGIDIGMNVQV